MTALLRWLNQKQKQDLTRLVHDLAAGGHVMLPWFRSKTGWHTPLVDLVELFDFVPKESGDGADD